MSAGTLPPNAGLDPLVPGAANPQRLNRSGYARNNPVRFTDPTGHTEADGQRLWDQGDSVRQLFVGT